MIRGAAVIVGLAGAVAAAQAQEGPSVALHGFGGWAYGKTNHNDYLAGLPDGDYRTSNFAINVQSNPIERLRITTQVEWQEDQHGGAVSLDYAFAEWFFSDALKLRAGQIKQPFGISTEVFRVGTLRPFFDLPQAVYGGVGLTGGKAIKGVSLTGTASLGTRWTISYDLYGGGVDQQEFVLPELFLRGEPVSATNEFELASTRDVVGAHVVVETPVPGLRVGGSGFTGIEVIDLNRRKVFGLQAEYLRGPWSLRGEYVHENVPADITIRGAYIEAAYRLRDRWQGAVQYGRLTTDLPGVNTSIAPSLLNHTEVAVGLNYWFSPQFVFKLSYHHVDGNRLAAPEPEDVAALVRSGALPTKTQLVHFGAQFSF
ncbi:MAG TPA: porin [Vicinamibacteria bacterium]|nr:porin [Vicinamibacteria bacterium]